MPIADSGQWERKHGRDPRHHFAQRERLGDVVVGAEIEAGHHILFARQADRMISLTGLRRASRTR